jgi:hypothetical protein
MIVEQESDAFSLHRGCDYFRVLDQRSVDGPRQAHQHRGDIALP